MRFAQATESIPEGATILVRGGMASKAGSEIANAVAIEAGKEGQRIMVKPIDGLGGRILQAMANGPIMDPNRIYLPAGKCSEEEMRRREA